MTQPSIYALGAIIKRPFEAVFSPSVVSTTFYMAQHQAARKPDWTSKKCCDVNQPRVQDRKADSPKLHFKLRQTVSLGEWWGMAYLCNQILTLEGSCQHVLVV